MLQKISNVKALQRRLWAEPAARLRYRPFIRTICGAYRTEILRREGLSFQIDPPRRLTVGQKLYLDLRERGYRTVNLPDKITRQYVVHLAHATQMLNAEQFGLRRVAKRWRRTVGAPLASEAFQALLQDDRLDL